MNKPKLILTSSIATILTIIFVVVITIWSELASPLKDWLKELSGHHWVSKGYLSIGLYALVTIILYISPFKYSDKKLRKYLFLVVLTAILGVLAITLFYTGHQFHWF